MSQTAGNEFNNKYLKKMSKAGQEEQEIVSQELNASFSHNSENER